MLPKAVRTLVPVIVGPAGSGKTTLFTELLQLRPHFTRCITETTRPPRSNEVNGKDYRFRTKGSFRYRKKVGHYVETARPHGHHWYGTPRKDFNEMVLKGGCVILSIDIVGFMAVRDYVTAHFPEVDVVGIFIDIPGPWEETLKGRMSDRDTADPLEIARRIETARFELDRKSACDVTIVNENFTAALEELMRFIDVRMK